MTESPIRPPSIPDEAAENFVVTAEDGVRLRVYAVRASAGAPTSAVPEQPALLWGHANGFAAGSYLPLLQMLTAHFRVFAFDARAHGGSDLPPAPLETGLTVDLFASDLGRIAGAVRARIGAAPFYYASHSFSGVAALRLAAVRGETPWRAMTVFEPPIVPAEERPEHVTAVDTSQGLIGLARRRRPHWASPAAFYESLVKRIPYRGFRPDMLAAHTRATLRPTGEGDYALCCPPEAEARIYEAVLDTSTFRALPQLGIPVHFVAGDPAPADGPPSWAALAQAPAAAETPLGRLTTLTGVGHMMPFEAPETCRDLVLDMLAPEPAASRNIG